MAVAEHYKTISNSKAKTFRRCEKQFEFKYVMGLKPKKRVLQLEKGSWVHDLLQHYYDGEDWKARHEFLSRDFITLFDEEKEELGDLPEECHRLVSNYIYHWRKEDKLYRVVDTELDETIELPNGIKIRIIVDKIVEDRSGGLWAVDYKTGKNQLDPDWLILDPQLGRYHWGLEYLGYTPLRGVIYDEIRTKPPTLPKLLDSGRLEQRKNIQCDVYTYVREINKQELDMAKHAKFVRYLHSQSEQWFKRTPLPKDSPLTKQLIRETVMTAREMKTSEEKAEFPRTATKDCKWDCAFRNPCIIQLTGGDIKPIIKMNYEPRHSIDEQEESRR